MPCPALVRLAAVVAPLLCLPSGPAPASAVGPPPPKPLRIPRLWHHVSTMPSLCNRSRMVEVAPGKWVSQLLAGHILKLQAANPHWEYRFWGPTDIDEFFVEYGDHLNDQLQLDGQHDDFRAVYYSLNPRYGAALADVFRYALVYVLGGLYLDLKTYSHLPFDGLLQPEDAFVAADWDRNAYGSWWGKWTHEIPLRGLSFANGFIAAVPGHPVLRAVLIAVMERQRAYLPECVVLRHCPQGLAWRFRPDNRNRRACYGHYGTLMVTGTIVYTNAVLECTKQATTEGQDLHFRLLSTDDQRDVVFDANWLMNLRGPNGTYVPPNQRRRTSFPRPAAYCTATQYYTLLEPLYLPGNVSAALRSGSLRLPPASASAPLAC
eukprot:EG_transcript_6005